VLLNYRLGDLGTLATQPCPCGRSLPLLAALDGRSDDIIALPSGRVVHPQVLRTVFTNEARVWQYQVVQEAPDRFRVAVVAAPGADRDELRARIAAGLTERVVDPVMIEVAFVDSIERTPGGKVRPIVSRCGNRGTNAVTGEADRT
jgi:phenylacetate-CoA ligase